MELGNTVSDRQKEAAELVRKLNGRVSRKPKKTLKKVTRGVPVNSPVEVSDGSQVSPEIGMSIYEVYNASSGPTEILNNEGRRILLLGPFERLEIYEETKKQLEESNHFNGLVQQNRVRFI